MIESREDLVKYNIDLVPVWGKVRPLPTKEEVYSLIEKEVGSIEVWPPCNYVLLKVYNPDFSIKVGKQAWERTEAFQKQHGLDTRVGKILCWGPDAFLNKGDFPTGRPYNIGQEVMFLRYENAFVNVGEYQLCYLTDVKLTLLVRDGNSIDTTHVMGK